MSSANSFGTFLETREMLKGHNGAPASRSAGGDPQADAAVRILKAPLPAPGHDLLASTSLPMDLFFETLRSLQEQGVLELRHTDQGDLVDLTARGRALLAE